MGTSADLAIPIIFMILLSGVTSRDIEVFVNDFLSIRCSPNEIMDIQWHFNSPYNFVYAGGKLRYPYDSRFRLESNETTGEYDLIIPKVTLEDAGLYMCSEELSGRRIRSTQLTVLYMKPACSSNMATDGFIGPNTCSIQQENMMFSCDVVFNGRPPHLSWRSANDNQTYNSSPCEVTSNRSRCSFTLRADPSYDGSIFRCDVGQIKLDDRRFSCNTKRIKVHYFFGEFAHEKKYVHETAICEVKSNLNVRYNWTLQQDDEEIFLTSNRTVSIEKPGIHQCQVEYNIRNVTCSTLLSVVNATEVIPKTYPQNEQSTATRHVLEITLPIASLLVIALVGLLIYVRKLRNSHAAVRMKSPLTEKEKSAIGNNRETLLSLINPDILIDLLEKESAINKSELASIPSKSTSREKNEILLKILKKGNLQLYWQTIKSLHQSNQSHVAEILETGGFSVECLPADIDGNEPLSRDVYIGFSPEDKETVDALIMQLRNNGINCYDPPLVSDKHAWIQNGVNKSKKCLLLWPSKYVKEEWYEVEKTAVLRKVERFGRDTVIIVKSKTKQKVPVELKEFKQIVLNKEQLDNPTGLIANLVTEIKREPRGIKKYGLAAGYFYGYLNIILKDFRKRLTGESSTEAPVSADCLPNTLKKLLIIFPESCICPSTMVTDGNIEFHKLIKFKVHRAGKIRDYASSLFKVKEGTEEYYFAGEFAASLSTLYDAYKEESSEMTEEQLHEERNVFFYSLKTILNQPKYAALKDQVKLVYWSDPESKNPNMVDLNKCLVEVLRKEIHSEQTLDYPMYKRPRGKCLIINTKRSENIDAIMAEEKDNEILQKLYQDLYFDVEIYTGVGSNDLNEALTKIKDTDHNSYDAFVCCILSHGNPEEIYTSDGNRMRILDIGRHFSDNQCPSLTGKPKMFFIQTFPPEESYPMQTVSSPSTSDIAIECSAAEQEIEQLLQSDADTHSPMPVVNESLLLPDLPDFLMSYSCFSGEVVTRDDGSASRYINALDECLRKGNEIDLALNEVTRKVREELEARAEFREDDLSKWLPFHRVSATRRRIYL